MRSRLFLAGPISLFALLGAGAALAAVDGDLDNSFSGDGRLVAEFDPANSAEAADAVVDSSGRLVVVGRDGSEIGVARINPDGSFDTTFGGDGSVQVDSGVNTGGERANAVAIDPATGNILVLGLASNPPNNDLVVARLLPNGNLDSTFDGPAGTGNGRFRFDFNDTESPADILASGDKVVFTASVGDGSSRVARVVQLTSTGALDTANFGTPNGFFDFQWAASTDSFAEGLTRQGDGKLIVSGSINGTATYGVARINTNGSLDTTFNASGTIPGVARPTLPAGFISARAFDVQVDSGGGIVVAGEIRAGSPTFDRDPMLSRLDSVGAKDTSFGTTSGFAILDAGEPETDTSVFSSLEFVGSGLLLAGGTIGPVEDRDQLLARFSATGTLDTGFSSDGFLRTDPGTPSTGLAAPVFNGVAYLTGQALPGGVQDGISVSAVCATVPPACPSQPNVPEVQMVAPPSGSNENNPRVIGMVPDGVAAVTAVNIYADPACTGPVLGSGSETLFETTGIPAGVPDNSTTTFYASASGMGGTPSACSTTSVTYTEVTPPAPPQQQQPQPATGAAGPTGQRAAALKRCAKIKSKPKKKRCKQRARALPV
jgi:uncharacterized delta-60 repeat protein